MRRRLLRGLVAFAVVAAGAWLGAVEIRQRFTHVHETDARVAGDLVTVSGRGAGRLVELAVESGDRVVRDQVIARLDARVEGLLLDQLEARLDAARAERERLAAERNLIDRRTGSRLETALSAHRAVQGSIAALGPRPDLARAESARAKSLYGKRVISVQELERAQAQTRRIEGEHRMAVAALEETVTKVDEARIERTRLDMLDREVDALGHREAELQGRIEQQRLDIADRTIRSPIDGVVDRVFAQAGEYVRPGQRLAIVHDPKRVWIEANVKETRIRKLAVGQPVEVRVDAWPEEVFRGRVRTIGSATTGSFALLPSPNPSGNFTKITQRIPVRIDVEQSGRRLAPGMMAEVYVDVRD